MSISEVMLDRWILENIDDAVPAWDTVEDIDKVNKNWRQSASDELSPEALDLLWMKLDSKARVLGSVGVITAYFVILHVNVITGVVLNCAAELISIPYFIRTKSWDVVIMVVFLFMISVSKLTTSWTVHWTNTGHSNALYYIHQHGTHHMTTTIVKHSHYKIEVKTIASPQHPITYFRKCGKCTTAKGMERQMERMVQEACDAWRNYEIKSFTVSRVPATEVPTNWPTGHQMPYT